METEQFPNVSSDLLEDLFSPSDCPELDYRLLETIELYLGGYFCTFLTLFGIVTNTAAIFFFSQRIFRSNFNNLLVALAVFDLIFLLISLIDLVMKKFLSPLRETSGHWLLDLIIDTHIHLIPYFLYPLHNIVFSASIFMTISISIERYLAIYSPLAYRSRFSRSGV